MGRSGKESDAGDEGELDLRGFGPALVSLGIALEGIIQRPHRLRSAVDHGDEFVYVQSRRGGTKSLAGYFEVERVTCEDCGINCHDLAGKVRLYITGEVEVVDASPEFKQNAYDIEGLRFS